MLAIFLGSVTVSLMNMKDECLVKQIVFCIIHVIFKECIMIFFLLFLITVESKFL